ncbi:Serine/threonine-protein kinase N2 [Larimichthys crocea]|uniref:Uncharacterized protein n=1 Tax=Larimichthys crocea TaxID=215358 RepID=A0ACD3QR63_LARCR|nr:Serine/threonine-protein kinase N2 [Larimichthys crocea]
MGTLDVRLMGCQDLLENVPGRSKAASVPLPGWSPSETRSSFISRANRNRGVSSRNLTKSEELSKPTPGPKHYPPPDNIREPLVQDKMPDKEEVQDALASFDFLNKRNSIAVKPDLDREVEQAIQNSDLELTAIQKDTEIRLLLYFRPLALCMSLYI